MLVEKWGETYRNFSEEEMRCKCGCGLLPDPVLMRHLQELRGVAAFPLPVTSGARCPRYNDDISGSGMNGPHTTGFAVDIAVSHKDAYDLLELSIGIFTGIGINQKGDSRFIHLDMLSNENGRPRPTVWSY